MSNLEMALPAVRRVPIPLSRDQLMLLMAAINEIFLGIDIYLAHSISGTIVPNEWIPIFFGPIAGVLLLVAGVIALRQRPLASIVATLVFAGSIVVGLLGAYFHLRRAILPAAPAGEQVTMSLLVWAPPVIGPLMFTMVGILGLSAAWVEDPPDSGRLVLFGGARIALPYAKTRAYLFIVSMGALATVISSVLDHARTHFENPWLWLPTGVGIFATVVTALVAALDRPGRADLLTFVGAMLLMMAVGATGAALHVSANLTAQGIVITERFVRGAPFLAPLLFANIGLLGLVALLSSEERESG